MDVVDVEVEKIRPLAPKEWKKKREGGGREQSINTRPSLGVQTPPNVFEPPKPLLPSNRPRDPARPPPPSFNFQYVFFFCSLLDIFFSK